MGDAVPGSAMSTSPAPRPPGRIDRRADAHVYGTGRDLSRTITTHLFVLSPNHVGSTFLQQALATSRATAGGRGWRLPDRGGVQMSMWCVAGRRAGTMRSCRLYCRRSMMLCICRRMATRVVQTYHRVTYDPLHYDREPRSPGRSCRETASLCLLPCRWWPRMSGGRSPHQWRRHAISMAEARDGQTQVDGRVSASRCHRTA